MNMGNYFSKKLICLECQKGMKFKRERKVGRYCCSTYDLGKGCVRTIIDHDFLLQLIEKRYQCKLDKGEIQSLVERIDVRSKYEFVIHFYNDESIVSMDGLVKY